MATKLNAKRVLTNDGWRNNVCLHIGDQGLVNAIEDTFDPRADNIDVLLPAPANLHSHSFQRAMAGMAEHRSGSSQDNFWTWRQVMYRFLELLTPQDIEAIAALVQMEMLEAGYASCGEFHYIHHGQNGSRYEDIAETSKRHFQAATETGIGLTHLPVLYMRGGLDDRPLQDGQLRFGCSLDEFSELHSKLQTGLKSLPNDFSLGVAPHSLRAVNQEGLQLAQTLCPTQPIHIHVAEQIAEIEEVSKALAQRPVEWLLDECDIDQRWCLVHATHMNQNEIRGLAESSAVVGLCPITEANLGDGIFNAPEYLKHHGRFGVGSDSNVLISLVEELRTLEYSQRLQRQARLVLTSDSARSNGRYMFDAITKGGAQALGRGQGGIAVGQWADLIALNSDHIALRGKSGNDLLDSWIFSTKDNVVTDVWSAGRHVVSNGRHKNKHAIEHRFNKTMANLRNKL